MNLAEIEAEARRSQLDVFGAFHPTPEDDLDGLGTLILLGPLEPGFWPHVTATPEFADAAPDPLDRWSTRTIGALAQRFGGTPFFPFGGPPYHPFIAWAKRSGRAWSSEVGLLVHDHAGLMVSYRGAIGLTDRLELPEHGDRPCDTCDEKPCLNACPIEALTKAGYDIPVCKHYLSEKKGQNCLDAGCVVRRSCPVGQGYGRLQEQSAYHMRRFMG